MRRSRWSTTRAGARVRVVLGLGLVAGLVLGGCGRRGADGPTPPGVYAGPTASTPSGGAADGIFTFPERPPACPPAARTGPLPSGSPVTAALRCGLSLQRVSGDGEWQMVVLQRATGPAVEALLAALALPSEPPSDGGCAAVWVGPTHVELETAGGTVTVISPVDPCHHPRTEVQRTYQAVPWVTVTSTKVRRLRSEAAVTSDCVAWKDLIAIEEPGAKPGSAGAVVLPEASLSICVYRSEYPPGWYAGSQDGVAGVPVGARKLTVEEARRLGTLLATAGPAASCTVAHTSFAVVTVAGGEPIYAELDGCLRVLTADETLRQDNAAVAALLKVA